jgi:hypothetical protein
LCCRGVMTIPGRVGSRHAFALRRRSYRFPATGGPPDSYNQNAG